MLIFQVSLGPVSHWDKVFLIDKVLCISLLSLTTSPKCFLIKIGFRFCYRFRSVFFRFFLKISNFNWPGLGQDGSDGRNGSDRPQPWPIEIRNFKILSGVVRKRSESASKSSKTVRSDPKTIQKRSETIRNGAKTIRNRPKPSEKVPKPSETVLFVQGTLIPWIIVGYP